MSTDRRIPEWLAPYKNEWRSMSTMKQLFATESRPLQTWLQEIRPRLRCVEKPSPNGVGVARYYLVKQVWACAMAHGVRLVPPPVPAETDQRIAVLQRENLELRGQLFQAQLRTSQVRVVASPDAPKMLSAMLTATEPRPMPGVYFLISDGVVVYVGQSQNVLARMSGHASKSFDTVKMLHVPDPTLRLVEEGRWIIAFKPRDNIKGLESRRAEA